MMTIGRALPEDLDDVVRILADASAWLHSRGLNQWPSGFAPTSRIEPYIARGEVWMVHDGDTPAATVRVNTEADAPQLWTPDERGRLALYLSKLAIDRRYAGQELGATVLRWITDYAALLGYEWVRLDAWRTNPGLHDYYLARGWEHVRTTELPGRHSTALFQRPAQLDPEARAMFAPRPRYGWFQPGTPVSLADRSQGHVVAIESPDSEHGEADGHSEADGHGVPGELASYRVRLGDGREINAARSQVRARLTTR